MTIQSWYSDNTKQVPWYYYIGLPGQYPVLSGSISNNYTLSPLIYLVSLQQGLCPLEFFMTLFIQFRDDSTGHTALLRRQRRNNAVYPVEWHRVPSCHGISLCGLYRASSLLRRLVSTHHTRFGKAEGASYTWIYLMVQMIRYASVDIKWGRTRLNPRWFALRGAVNPDQEHAGTGDLGWKNLAEIYIFFPNDCRLDFFHF